MRTLFDTSVLVSAVTDQLVNHEAALDALVRYAHGEHEGYCSTHALAECYATLTALPLRTRIVPAEAIMLVEENILAKLSVIDLSVDDYRNVLRRVAKRGLTSGAIYDALHMDCAHRLAVDQILTCNVSHFDRFQVPGIAIREP